MWGGAGIHPGGPHWVLDRGEWADQVGGNQPPNEDQRLANNPAGLTIDL